jgi:hypothetical protein
MFHNAPLRYGSLTGNIHYKSEYSPIKARTRNGRTWRDGTETKMPNASRYTKTIWFSINGKNIYTQHIFSQRLYI